MMNSEILNSAANLMLYGMGTVFIFLGILVAITSLGSILLRRFAPDLRETSDLHKQNAHSQDLQRSKRAATIAVLHHHRKRQDH